MNWNISFSLMFLWIKILLFPFNRIYVSNLFMKKFDLDSSIYLELKFYPNQTTLQAKVKIILFEAKFYKIFSFFQNLSKIFISTISKILHGAQLKLRAKRIRARNPPQLRIYPYNLKTCTCKIYVANIFAQLCVNFYCTKNRSNGVEWQNWTLGFKKTKVVNMFIWKKCLPHNSPNYTKPKHNSPKF